MERVEPQEEFCTTTSLHPNTFERAVVHDVIGAAACPQRAMQQQPHVASHDSFGGRHQLSGQVNAEEMSDEG